MTKPFVRELGSGPTVVCLHSSASSSAQWRSLAERLSGRFRVLAVDLHGCGRTPAWAQPRPLRLDDEVELLDAVWRSAGARFHVVGHSYGGAVAMKAALAHAGRVASLAVYEPSMFGLLTAHEPDSAAAREIESVRKETMALVAANDLGSAASRFGSYWLGQDTWNAMPQSRKEVMAAAMPSVMPQWQAVFEDAPSPQMLRALSMPVQLVSGSGSTLAAIAVTQRIARALPHAVTHVLPHCGHMAPVTAPEHVNPVIEQFLNGL